MKMCCKELIEHATKIINYDKKEMIALKIEESKSHRKQKSCYKFIKGFCADDDNKKYHKTRDHCHYARTYRRAAHNICNLKYKTSKEIPIVFNNGSIYDFRFIIKELAEEFE